MKMIIDGQMSGSESGKAFEIVNPATGRVIDTVPQATERDIERAVEAAVRGQKEWEKVPVWKRGEILYRFSDIVEQNKEELAQTLCSENGKPIVEARAEIANIKISFSAFIEQAKHYYGSIIPAGQEQGQETNLQLVTREAIGVVACIIPFNFPV